MRHRVRVALYNRLFARSILTRRHGVGNKIPPWGKGLKMSNLFKGAILRPGMCGPFLLSTCSTYICTYMGTSKADCEAWQIGLSYIRGLQQKLEREGGGGESAKIDLPPSTELTQMNVTLVQSGHKWSFFHSYYSSTSKGRISPKSLCPLRFSCLFYWIPPI